MPALIDHVAVEEQPEEFVAEIVVLLDIAAAAGDGVAAAQVAEAIRECGRPS